MEDHWSGWLEYLPLASGILAAYLIIGGEWNMDTAIIVALIGLSGTAIIELIKAFKDGSIIRKTNDQTSDMYPKVDNIAKLTEAQSKNISALASDLEYRKRLEAQFPQSVAGSNMIYAGVGEMLKQQESIDKQYQEAKDQIKALKIEVANLSSQCRDLSAENAVMRDQIQRLGNALRQAQQHNIAPNQEWPHDDWEPEM